MSIECSAFSAMYAKILIFTLCILYQYFFQFIYQLLKNRKSFYALSYLSQYGSAMKHPFPMVEQLGST